MEKYLGVKIIEAEPMTMTKAAEELQRPFESGSEEGYFIKYQDGYESWSPREVFEEAYRKIDNLTFGLAIEALKKGYKVAREGWNGKGMFLILVITPPTEAMDITGHIYGFLPYIQMKTADNKLVPWLASQTDMLSEDWMVVE